MCIAHLPRYYLVLCDWFRYLCSPLFKKVGPDPEGSGQEGRLHVADSLDGSTSCIRVDRFGSEEFETRLVFDSHFGLLVDDLFV